MMHINEQKTGSILIVDDEQKNIQLLGNILQKKGYDIEFAMSGEEALNWVSSSDFDLILLDVTMPTMSGFEVCNTLKGSHKSKDIPIVFLTGRTNLEDVVKGFEYGAVDYITKPFNVVELLVRVNTHLELKFSRDLLKEMAIRDGLTNLYNHTHILERLSQELNRARRHGHQMSVIMLDLDHFKAINDTYGHKVGDDVLMQVSLTMAAQLRKEDIPGRYGGEEFLIILPSTSREAGYHVAERIRTEILQLQWQIEELRVTISGGLATFEGKEKKANELIVKADKLLYNAKNNGKNRIEVH